MIESFAANRNVLQASDVLHCKVAIDEALVGLEENKLGTPGTWGLDDTFGGAPVRSR